MLPPVRPSLDPLAQRAAINALEAQRAAYRRYARTVDDQTHAIGTGDAERAVAASDAATRGFDELDAGARALRPHLDRVREQGSPDQQAEVQRQLGTLATDAERAQSAIQNLTAQLDAWRVAYGRQLASIGLAPGGTDPAARAGLVGTDGASGVGVPAPESGLDLRSSESRPHERGYGPRGQSAVGHPAPKLLNRLG